jgi:PAS domain S-box-containing protein
MSSPIHVLHVENDAADAELVRDTLAMEGIVCDVTRVETEPAFSSALLQGGFELILADYTLPSFDGLSALRIARQQRPDLPFLFVSGTLGEEVAIEVLKIGATDYVLKTRLSRLVPSVQRALREATERAELRRSEDALRRSETNLAIAQSLSHTGSFGWNLSTGAIDWSLETFRIFELDPDTKPTLEFILQRIHPEDRVSIQETIDRIVFGRIDFQFEHRLLMPDGRVKYLRVLGGAQDPCTDCVGAVTDITERKRAEQAREEIDEQWRAAFENNPTMYFMLDAAGIIVSINNFGAEQLGYNVNELLGQPVLNVFYPADRDAVQRHANECFKHPGQTMRWEARKIRKDGTMLWVRETARAVSLKKRPVVLVVCEEITEQKRAQEAARRSERELRDVIESIPAIAWTASPDGSNTFVNRRWAEYTGLSVEDSTGWDWNLAAHPEDIGRYLEKWGASLATAQPFEDEIRLRRAADGQYRWFLSRGSPLEDEQGNIIKWFGVLSDIEDRKRAEALLAGEKRILEMVAKGDSLPEILDSLCRLVEEQASGALASILLVDGSRLRHGGAPSLPKAYTEAVDGIVIGPSTGSCGTSAYRGEQVIVADIATDPLWTDFREAALPHSLRACWSTPIFSSEGKVIATFAMYYQEPRSPSPRDQEIIEQITHLSGVAIERNLTFEQLQRSEAYLAEAQKLSHTGTWAWDPSEKKNLYWSEEMFRICGLEPRPKAPNLEEARSYIHPGDYGRISASIVKAVREKADFVEEQRLVLPDGTLKHVQSIGHPVLDETGQLVEYVGTMRDVTERKRAEKERERLRQLEADLAHINRVSMMGELTASLSHELRQPLTAAIANAHACVLWLSRDKPDIEEALEATLRIIRDSSGAAEIIDRTRELYKKSPPRRELVDVNEIVGEMLVLLRGETNRYSIAVSKELAVDLPKITADRVQLQQVFMNLMLNGIEAMKDSGGELTVKSHLCQDGQLMISISDTGLGLPTENADHIFDAFFTTKPQGSGMGLAITRSIVESHGGHLWATANSAQGATFHFTLPTAASGHEIDPHGT